jgi:hypothetical protein
MPRKMNHPRAIVARKTVRSYYEGRAIREGNTSVDAAVAKTLAERSGNSFQCKVANYFRAKNWAVLLSPVLCRRGDR